MSALKGHPEYSRGYFAALDGGPCSGGHEAYQVGYAKGKEAIALLTKDGFTQTGRSFSVTLKARGDSSIATLGATEGGSAKIVRGERKPFQIDGDA